MRHAVGKLQQNGTLTNTRLTSNKIHTTLDDTATEHYVYIMHA
jgi:hypothetical protein